MHARLRKLGQKLKLSVESLTAVFEFLELVSLLSELFNRWRQHHEVKLVVGGAFKLDGAWRVVSIKVCPLVSDSCISLEHTALKLDQSLLNHRLVFARASLQAHHSWEWTSGRQPVGWVLVGEVLDAGHVASDTLTDQHGSVKSKRVAVLGVEVAGQGASSLVAKEVALREELAGILVLGLAVLKLFLDEENEEFLGVNL